MSPRSPIQSRDVFAAKAQSTYQNDNAWLWDKSMIKLLLSTSLTVNATGGPIEMMWLIAHGEARRHTPILARRPVPH